MQVHLYQLNQSSRSRGMEVAGIFKGVAKSISFIFLISFRSIPLSSSSSSLSLSFDGATLAVGGANGSTVFVRNGPSWSQFW